jgi:hypothetical protein
VCEKYSETWGHHHARGPFYVITPTQSRNARRTRVTHQIQALGRADDGEERQEARVAGEDIAREPPPELRSLLG